MIVRDYIDSDYEKVFELVSKEQGPLPEKLGGVGIIIEEDDDIIGFIWCLISNKSEIAFEEYFVVREDKRNALYGAVLQTRMFKKLADMGIKTVCACFKDFAPYTETLVKIAGDIGMSIQKGYVVSGDPYALFNNLMKRGLE